MSKEAIKQFREAINGNEEWQEEVRNFGDDDSMATYASSKGFEFTSEEYVEYVEGLQSELTEFETEMVVGGGTCKEKGHKHNRRLYKNKDGSVHGKLPDWVNPISRKSGNLTQTCIFGRYGRKYVGKNATSGQGETHDYRGDKWDW